LDESPKAERIGWVRPLTPQDPDVIGDDAHWDISDCVVGSGVMLRARFERRKVPTSLLQMLFRQKIGEHTKETGKSMPRFERQKLKQDLAESLLRRTLPHITHVDVLWRVDDQELFIFNRSKTLSEKILQLFIETFTQELGLDVIKFSATTAWLDTDETAVRLDQLAKVEPALFARQMI
jgi:DNA recombination-dependent growth factor C